MIPFFNRMVIIAFCTFSLFALLIIQFFRIQLIEGEKWSEVARRQHFFVVQEPFQRGTFFANSSLGRGHIEEPQQLAMDIEAFHLHADPDSVPPHLRASLVAGLTDLISGLDSDYCGEQLKKKSRNRRLAAWLDRQQRDELLSWWRDFSRAHKIAKNALFVVPDYRRSYPFGHLLGPVLHTVQRYKDEETGRAKPTGGLELAFDSLLSGKRGKRLLMRSPRNAFATGELIEMPQHGADVYLTINHVLQAIAEEELEKGAKRCGAKGGWAVMMEPRTGEILALAQYPFFDLTDYGRYFGNPELIGRTRLKAITDPFEPGSVVKPFTLAAALLANREVEKLGQPPIFDPNEMLPALDGHFPGRKPLRDISPHHYLNMAMALQKSSNIYMARLVERIVNRLGKDWYHTTLSQTFGFGRKTGIELPGESSGFLPRPGKLYPSGRLEWSVPTPFSLAMGYNLGTTSLQVVRAWAIFANGGVLVEPTLVKRIASHAGGVDLPMPQKERRPVLPPAIVREVVGAMKYATKPGGTCRRAEIWGYTEIGKTGTANRLIDGKYVENKTLASCIGFTPVEEPAFVLLVSMDEAEARYLPGIGKNHHGSVAAAPVFQAIATRALAYLGIAPDDVYGYPKGDPRYHPDKADWMEETRQLREMYEKWNK